MKESPPKDMGDMVSKKIAAKGSVSLKGLKNTDVHNQNNTVSNNTD